LREKLRRHRVARREPLAAPNERSVTRATVELRVLRVDDQQTLDDLDPPAWGSPTYDSYLVVRTHELRRVPLGQFTTEDLRIMIGQQIGLPHLVPLALVVLANDPLASGDFFSGDLLEVVMRLDDVYWADHPAELQALIRIVDRLVPIDGEVRAAVEAFRGRHH
jgi:hypothetical protein